MARYRVQVTVTDITDENWPRDVGYARIVADGDELTALARNGDHAMIVAALETAKSAIRLQMQDAAKEPA